MWPLMFIAVLVGTVVVVVPIPPATAAIKGLTYMKQIDGAFDEFLSASDNVKVVYFCRGI